MTEVLIVIEVSALQFGEGRGRGYYKTNVSHYYITSRKTIAGADLTERGFVLPLQDASLQNLDV